jgi:hypothetical protein
LTACTLPGDREEKQRECDAIANEIRATARSRGISPQGACTNPNIPEVAARCTDLKKCNAELDDM